MFIFWVQQWSLTIQNIPKPLQVAHKAFSNHLVFPNTAMFQHGWPQISDKQRKNNKHRSGPFCPNLSPLELPGSPNNTRRKSETNAKHSLLSPYTVSYSSEMLQLKNSLRGKKSGWEEQVVTACNGFIDWTCWLSRDLRELSSGLMRFWEDDISLSCWFKDFL